MDRSMTATLKYAITSDKKLNLIAKIVRGKSVQKALEELHFMPKKAAKILGVVVKSAAMNAKNVHGYQLNELFVSKIEIGKGPNLKRMRFVGRSRTHKYEKYRAFVRVVLGK